MRLKTEFPKVKKNHYYFLYFLTAYENRFVDFYLKQQQKCNYNIYERLSIGNSVLI